MTDKTKLPLSGNMLKIIACATMLTDHIGAVIFPSLRILRIIGRIAMPIYCYMIASGAKHTRNKPKYVGRMLVFMVLTEIPFDLAFHGVPFYWGYQSVMVTLTLGLIAALLTEVLKEKINTKLYILPSLILFITAGILAQVSQADYGYLGVMMIAVFYYFEKHPIIETIGILLIVSVITSVRDNVTFLTTEVYAIFAMAFILLHNGTKGRDSKALKYGFYAFYPVHLLILGLINVLILQ